jgi:hypothetical protein
VEIHHLGPDEVDRVRTLVAALRDLARQLGCHGMWIGPGSDNTAALATYRSAGADEPEPCVTLTWTF